MATKQFVCGATPDAPINGQLIFTAEFLKDCFVNFLIINNVNESPSCVTPDFTHSYITGSITRNFPWVTGDNLIVDYTKCNCK